MKESKNKFSITMPPKLQEQADLIATELGMNRISFINLCVANYIENRKVASTVDSLRDAMIDKMNNEFEKMLKGTKKVTEKAKVIKG